MCAKLWRVRTEHVADRVAGIVLDDLDARIIPQNPFWCFETDGFRVEAAAVRSGVTARSIPPSTDLMSLS